MNIILHNHLCGLTLPAARGAVFSLTFSSDNLRVAQGNGGPAAVLRKSSRGIAPLASGQARELFVISAVTKHTCSLQECYKALLMEGDFD